MVLVLCRGVCCVVACCVVVLCFGALGCMLVCGVKRCHTVLCVVTWRFVALYSTLRCVMAYRCLVVCCGLVFLVVGLVIACCVSALRGVVFLFCGLCSIGVPCSSVRLCLVVLFGEALPWLCGGVLVTVLCCVVLCCCEWCCVVLGYVLCLGSRFVVLSCGVV